MGKRGKRRKLNDASGDAIFKLRIIGLCLSLLILAGLVIATILIRPTQNDLRANRKSVLEESFGGDEFREGASSEQVLVATQAAVDDLIARYPNDPDVHNVAARKAMQLGETDSAKRQFEIACEMSPHLPEALFGLGMLAYEADDYSRALGYFEDVSVASPGDPRVPLAIADSLLRLGKIRQCMLVLEQQIASEQTSVEAWVKLGQANLQNKKYERAIICFETALSFNADSKDAVYGMARSLAGKGDREKAKEFNDRFRMLAKEDRETNTENAKDFSDVSYARAICAQVYVDAHRVELRHGHSAKAEESLLKAVLLSENLEWLRELRELYRTNQKLNEATDVAERIVVLEPTSIDDLIALGGLLASLEQTDAAITSFRKAIEVDPNDERCIQAKKTLESLNSK